MKKIKHALNVCPECGGSEFIEDPSRGELICAKCGLVLKEKIIDTTQEWRAFDSEQMARRARGGAPLAFSVDYNEPIIIKESGKLKIVKIGEFVDEFLKNSEIEENDGIEVLDISDKGIEVLCFDENYKATFKPISEVSRHKIDEIYEIELETGRKIKVTGAHSVFSVEEGIIRTKKVSELKVGDFIVAPLRIPSPIEIKEIDVVDEFSKISLQNIFIRNVDENIFEILKLIKNDLGISSTQIKNWKRYNTLPLKIYSKIRNLCNLDESRARIGIYNSKNTLPLKLPVNEEFAWLLGIFMAKGTAKDYEVMFSLGLFETATANAIREIMQKMFNLDVQEYRHNSSLQLTIKSKLLSLLFSEILKTGEKAREKRVPDIVFNFSEKLKKEFIKGYLIGDGHVYIRENRRPDVQIEFTTSSKDLINSMRMVFSQLGLNLNTTEAIIPSHKIFTGQVISETQCYFGKLTNPDSLVTLGFVKEIEPRKRKNAIENLIPAPEKYKKEWRYRKRIRISRKLAIAIAYKYGDYNLLKLANSDFIFLRVKNLKKIKPTTEYAYDLSVPKYENFGGTVFYHNTKHDKGLTTEIGRGLGELYKVPPKKRAQYYRLTKWHKRFIRAKDRNISFAFSELQRMVSSLNLPKTIHERVARLYEECVEKGLVRGRSIEAIVAALIYGVSREFGAPRTPDEMAEVSGVDKREIGRTYRYIARELGMRILPARPEDFVPRFCSILGLSDKAVMETIKILRKARKKDIISGKGPTGVAAAAIYIGSVLAGEKRTQREIADTFAITEVTIRARYREIVEALGIEEEVEKKAGEES